MSEGKWAVEGGTVLLTTDPMPPQVRMRPRLRLGLLRPHAADLDEGENLILWRWDAQIVLKPVQPRPR